MNPTSPSLPRADLDRWLSESWHTDRRYYHADIIQDLFGTWLVRRSWGGIGSKRGHSIIRPADNYDHALTMLSDIAKRRQKRGYMRT